MVAPEAYKEISELEAAAALTLWDAELERLDARSDLTLARLEERYYRILRDLRAKEKAIRAELRELHGANRGTQQQAGEHLSELMRELEAALQRAASEIA